MFPLNYTEELFIHRDTHCNGNALTLASSFVKATMPLEAQLDDELSFDVGDVIEIIEPLDEGWAKGRNGAMTGTFPLSFTKPYVSNASLSAPVFPDDAVVKHSPQVKSTSDIFSYKEKSAEKSAAHYPAVPKKPVYVKQPAKGTVSNKTFSKAAASPFN